MVVTGLVVGVDPTAHTVSLVDPSGGAIRTINVVTPEGQQSMKLHKDRRHHHGDHHRSCLGRRRTGSLTQLFKPSRCRGIFK